MPLTYATFLTRRHRQQMVKAVLPLLAKRLKYNENHDERGRFAESSSSRETIAQLAAHTWYHGSTQDRLSEFDDEKIRGDDADAPYTGIWLSSNPDTSPAWVNPQTVYTVHAEPTKVLTRPEATKFAATLRRNPGYEAALAQSGAKGEGDYVRLQLLRAGYDAIVHEQKPAIDMEQLERTGRTQFELNWAPAELRKDTSRGFLTYDLYQRGQHITGYENPQELIDQTDRVLVLLKASIGTIEGSRPSWGRRHVDIRASRLKFNEHHDELGRFAENDGGASADDRPSLATITEATSYRSGADRGAAPAPDKQGSTWTPTSGGTIFHGTSAAFNVWDTKLGYLTDDFKEAEGYAHGAHYGGGRGKWPMVMRMQANPGKTLDIDSYLAHGMQEDYDPDNLIKWAAEHGRSTGARYLTYEHPSNIYDDRQQRVVVSLYPNEDVKLEKLWRRPNSPKKDWQEEDHPREPAGSPTGGQFAGGGRFAEGDGGGASIPARVDLGEVYRGGGMRDEAQRGGQYYSLSRTTASQYGSVTSHALPPQAVIDLHNDPVATRLIASMFPDDVREDGMGGTVASLFITANRRLSSAIHELGYTAMRVHDMIFVFSTASKSIKDFDESEHPREPAGSAEGGQFTSGDGGGGGAAFSNAPMTSQGAAAWRKSMQETYNTDKEFKATADAIALFTQGDYTVLRGLAEHELTGEWNRDLKGTLWETAFDEKMQGMPGYDYKDFFKGQDVKAGGTATWKEGVRALVNAVDSASPIDQPMYRGLNGYEIQKQVLALKPGDDFTVVAPTSFTADRNLAVKWSQGKVSGQGGGSFDGPTIIIEVQSGAKGLKVAALSPFKQSEIISSGMFKVVRVESGLDESRRFEQTRLVLQQHSTRRISQ